MSRKFCCENFETYYSLPKQASPNIRVVKFISDWLINSTLKTLSGKIIPKRLPNIPFRFFITLGYTGDFDLDMVMLNISFCPFCGINLFKKYAKDDYANEIEGVTFKLTHDS